MRQYLKFITDVQAVGVGEAMRHETQKDILDSWDVFAILNKGEESSGWVSKGR